MPEKALIVDDSRTARVVLRDLLSKRGVAVDAVDSAESSLKYLADNCPDLIFMDHMMPGMDGFEAVKRIRSDPAIAHIPIVMYTSRGGDMYFGQARALGADDLLRKPPTAGELDGVLERLQHRGEPEVMTEASPGTPGDYDEPLAREPHPSTLESPAHFTDKMSEVAGGDAPALPMRRVSGGWWLTAAISLVLLWLLFASGGRVPAIDRSGLAKDLEWFGNHDAVYAFDDVPFSDSRLAVVQRVVDVLHRAGVKARITLRAHVGQFCRITDGRGDLILPPLSVPVESCELVGYGSEEAQRLSQRISPRFQAWLSEHDGSDGVEVEIESVGVVNPLFSYPPQQQVRTAGDWNRIAVLNNRVEMIVDPR